ncbi:hypothetical protein PoB_002520300 [Plakobranchus ocellatus]|uniref:Uncharacterized protein n=1 Tax=Plakobranchus ocellatus TaxID=259542 RepID=A0AAV3ZW97_9GAST|nr:hypothetical protein PoB_002520300 [Plakobranchus ocellatus]
MQRKETSIKRRKQHHRSGNSTWQNRMQEMHEVLLYLHDRSRGLQVSCQAHIVQTGQQLILIQIASTSSGRIGASPQQRDLRLTGPPSGQGAGGGARTRDRRFPADLRADSLATVPPTPRKATKVNWISREHFPKIV